MEERAIDRLRKFARYARDKGVVKGENSFEAYCELSNRYIYNSVRTAKGSNISCSLFCCVSSN